MISRYSHPEVGEISVRVLSTARNISARWKTPDKISVTVPSYAHRSDVERALAELIPRLLKKRPRQLFYTPGWHYETPEMTFEVVSGTKLSCFEGIVDRVGRRITLMMPPDIPQSGTEEFNQWVKKAIDSYARKYAQSVLIPMARELAVKLCVNPSDIGISYGQRVLGRCNSRGEILLSRNLIFYPLDLREMVIAHEFAHLTHMDHSQRFKQLLNSYLGGRLPELNRRFKTFKLPFL